MVEPLIPPAKRGVDKRTVDVREAVNGIMYILRTGCQWAALPKDLPPRSTTKSTFLGWEYNRTLDRLHHALYIRRREQAGRNTSPTVAIIDSQSVKSTEKRGLSDPHGYDSGKKIKGKKRHVFVVDQGLLMQAMGEGHDPEQQLVPDNAVRR